MAAIVCGDVDGCISVVDDSDALAAPGVALDAFGSELPPPQATSDAAQASAATLGVIRGKIAVVGFKVVSIEVVIWGDIKAQRGWERCARNVPLISEAYQQRARFL